MHPSQLPTTIREIVEPTLTRLGFDLVAVELVGGRRRQVLRLSIDKPGGVGADDCATASVRLGPLLDAADPMPGAYDLEVSSPGIERPVQRRSDFRRFRGLRARLRLEEGLPRRRYTGEIRGVVGDDLYLRVDGALHTVSLESIVAAHLVLDLDEYNRLGEGLPPVPDGEDDILDEADVTVGSTDAAASSAAPTLPSTAGGEG